MHVPSRPQGGIRNWKSLLTHCANGHEFTDETTYISPKSQKRCCRICQSARVKRIYEKDLDGNREKGRLNMQVWRDANRDHVNQQASEARYKKKEWLDSHKTPCSNCGEPDIACLDFHHKDASTKEANLASAIAHWSIPKLEAEMKKCIVLCANCHRKLHAAERDRHKES